MVDKVVFDSVSSTMDEARSHAKFMHNRYAALAAHQQTSGRGRRGRAWESEPGNLYVTFIIKDGIDLAKAPLLSFVAAIALVRGLEQLTGLYDFSIKWPNDILFRGQKLAGILLETIDAYDGCGVIIGIGLNLKTHPESAVYPATNLSEHGISLDFEVALDMVANALQMAVDKYLMEGFRDYKREWLEKASGLGETIAVQTGGQIISGVMKGITDDGELMITMNNGKSVRITAGDVIFGDAHTYRGELKNAARN